MKKSDENDEKWKEKRTKYTDGHLHDARHGPNHDQAVMEPTGQRKGMKKMLSKSCGDRHTYHGVHRVVQNGKDLHFALVATATSIMASAMQFDP